MAPREAVAVATKLSTMNHNKNNALSPALAALYSAAFALPIYNKIATAAGTPDNSPSVNVRISKYDEDRLSNGDFSGIGDRKRYDIEVGQIRVVYPINDTMQLTVDSAYEKMSGASPWFIIPDANGDPVQVMSGATIDDRRFDFNAKLDIFKGNYTISPNIGISTEKDYDSVFGGISVARELDNKTTTLRGGIAASFDEVKPTDDPLIDPGRIDSDDKEAYTAFVGIGQVTNKNTVVQSTLTLGHYNGFLSDPYKLVTRPLLPGEVAGIDNRDNRPDDRTQYIWSLQLRRWSELFNAALHADYRFYYDDWEIRSHTLDLGFLKHTDSGWSFEYSMRYYSQTQAEFYEPFYQVTRSDGYYSSDYRLSPYGALSFRVKLAETIGDWTVSFSAERYISDKSYSLQSVDVENPGLVDFTLFTFGVDYVF